MNPEHSISDVNEIKINMRKYWIGTIIIYQ